MKRNSRYSIVSLLLVVTLLVSNISSSFAMTRNLDKKLGVLPVPLSNRYENRVVEVFEKNYTKVISQKEASSTENYEKALKLILGTMALPMGYFGGVSSLIMGLWTTPVSREGTYSVKKYRLENRQYDRLTNKYKVVRRGVKLYISHKGESTTYQYWLK